MGMTFASFLRFFALAQPASDACRARGRRLMAVLLQLIAGGHADHASTENDYPHDLTPWDSGAIVKPSYRTQPR
jgi:hypothetical protein